MQHTNIISSFLKLGLRLLKGLSFVQRCTWSNEPIMKYNQTHGAMGVLFRRARVTQNYYNYEYM